MRILRFGLPAIVVLLGAIPVAAETTSQPSVNSGDTAWLLTSTALVMLMTVPGLALFYGGLVGRTNVLSTTMHSFFLLCLISIQWVVVGYTLSFGPDHSGLVGGLQYLGFAGVGQAAHTGTAVPDIAFAMYQCAFAVITVALITGAFAERMRFGAFVAFSLIWATVIYDPLAHWVWGGGWLQTLGALDFAGGTVVHVSSGVSALVAACLVGRRARHGTEAARPHAALLTIIGTGLLWFGWFGFNAGSALTSGGLAAMAFAATNTAAAAAALGWAIIERAKFGRPSCVGVVTGAVAGLVAITPAAGYVTVGSALVIGLGASVVAFVGVHALKPRFGYDDSLDVFGVHGLCGIWGALATGIFASLDVNPAGANGLLAGNPSLVVKQAVAVAACGAAAGIGTFVILKAIEVFVPLRVTPDEEAAGLDIAVHGELAYDFLHGETPARAGTPQASYASVLADEAFAEA